MISISEDKLRAILISELTRILLSWSDLNSSTCHWIADKAVDGFIKTIMDNSSTESERVTQWN